MSSYLISISIGPVQDFIAQARRSRDLWFGSHLLSEIARAAARSIAQAKGTLIFPAVDGNDPELLPCDAMRRPGLEGDVPLAVANKLLAQVADREAAERCILAARQAARSRWLELADQARHHASSLIDWSQVQSIWKEQVDGVLEFYAAAAPVTEGEFAKVRDALERTLAARKNLREFQQFQHHRPGAPKSSFDGGRVSVLRPPSQSREVRRKFRIPQAENLDAVGVVKRAGGQPEQFVPITNVALAGWLTEIRQNPEVGPQVDELEQTMRNGDLRELFGRVERNDLPAGRAFRSDAQVFLEGRLEAIFIELTDATTGRELRSNSTYQGLLNQIRNIRKAVPTPPTPYVAVLVADGDRMGASLSRLDAANEMRQFSKHLSQFAQMAREIVEQESLGSLLYAGGDDVVAFLPLGTAVACAARLRLAFTKLMAPGRALPESWSGDAELPTLSVGIGIGHVLDGMGNLLELGREAERLAKGSNLPAELQRDALAILVDKRSGGKLNWRARWSQHVDQSADAVVMDAMARVGKDETSSLLPATKLAQVRRHMLTFPRQVAPGVSAMWADVVRRDVLRTLRRSGRGLLEQDPRTAKGLSAFGLNLETDSYQQVREELDAWTNLHLIAKELNRSGNHSVTATEE